MALVAVIGEAVRTEGFALAGALVRPAEDAQAAAEAWRSLPAGVAVVVLTERAAAWLGDDELRARDGVLVTVLPGRLP